MTDELTWVIGGPQGSGINVAAESLAKLAGNNDPVEPAGDVVGNGRVPSAKGATAEPK